MLPPLASGPGGLSGGYSSALPDTVAPHMPTQVEGPLCSPSRELQSLRSGLFCLPTLPQAFWRGQADEAHPKAEGPCLHQEGGTEWGCGLVLFCVSVT